MWYKIILVCFICCFMYVSAFEYPPHLANRTCAEWRRDPVVDCLKPTRADCETIGCNWHQGFAGPWCHVPVPAECNSIREKVSVVLGYVTEEISLLNPLQLTAGAIAFGSLLITIVLMFWGNYVESQTSKIKVDSAQPTVATTVVVPETKSSSGIRKRGAPTRGSAPPKTPTNAKVGKPVYSGPSMVATDYIISGILFAISMGLHLWRLEDPPLLTYDECHFGYFTSKYFKREYLFDIHPPFAKLTFWFLGGLLGYDPGPGANFQYKGHMGTLYENWYQFMPLRFIASVFGSGVVPVLYLICRRLRVSPAISILGSSLVLWDTILLGESRTILTDSQLVFWNVLTMYAMFCLFYTPDREHTKKELDFWTVFTAICCGCVFGVKLTTLATLGLIGLEATFSIFIIQKKLSLPRCLVAGVIGLSIWLVWWWGHFALLTHDHSETNWHDAHFQSTFIGNQYYGKLDPPNFFVKVYQLVISMIKANASTLDPHAWASFWYEWIYGRGRVLSAHGKDWEWEVSIFSNPGVILVTLLTLLSAPTIALLFTRYQDRPNVNTKENRRFIGLVMFLLAGFLVNVLPYIGIARTTFVYHYLPGLLYLQILTAVLLNKGSRMLTKLRKFEIVLCSAILFVVVLFWWYCSPWVYAIPITRAQGDARRILLGNK